MSIIFRQLSPFKVLSAGIPHITVCTVKAEKPSFFCISDLPIQSKTAAVSEGEYLYI